MLPLASYLPKASQFVYGCMGLGGGCNETPLGTQEVRQAQEIIETCLEHEITVFDHADIYTFGKAEQAFGQVLAKQPHLREQMILQSKCAIRFADAIGPKRYDFSGQYITESVEGILQRLSVEQLDILILHRPDPLMDIREVAMTIEQLQRQGKILHVGVSNMAVGQIQLLQSSLNTPLVCNQIEMSLGHHPMIESNITANNAGIYAQNDFVGLLEYAQLHNIQLQAWGSLAQGRFSKSLSNYSKSSTGTDVATAKLVHTLADKYSTTATAIVLAFLLRLPQGIQPVIGTTNTQRITECVAAQTIALSHADWFALLVTVRGEELP